MEAENLEYLRAEFEKFYTENYLRFYYYAQTLVFDAEICKDLVNDSFHYLYERIHSFQPQTARTYMYTHVHNLCIYHIRHTQVEGNNREAYLEMVREWNNREHLESEERIRIIMQMIDEMQEPTHTIMKLCYFHKKKYREVAEMVGMTESGVRKQIMKGLDIIRVFFNVKYKKGQRLKQL